ncbi:MAG TPA: hypothetical protein VGF99_08010, partial [Myxococcota bacterium]
MKQLDDSAWPIAYARFTGESSLEGFQRYTAWLEAMVERARREQCRFVCVNDARGTSMVSAEVRRAMAAWVSDHGKTAFDGVALGTIVVVDNVIVRGVMTAISWVNREQMNKVVSVATVEEAWRHA